MYQPFNQHWVCFSFVLARMQGVHALRNINIFEDKNTEGILLVGVWNVFNRLNHGATLQIIQVLCPAQNQP